MNLLFKITYGLFLVCAKDGEKDNLCVCNTLMQQSSNPERFSITLNKNNLTTQMIQKTKKCVVAILSQETPFDVFKDYGMRSGKDCDKLQGKTYDTSESGIKVPTEGVIGFFEYNVVNEIDMSSHIMFVVEASNNKVIKDGEPVTYSYYQSNIKPKPQVIKADEEVWICSVCGYVHKGPLPADFVCPLCKHGAKDFVKQEQKSASSEIKTENKITENKGEKTMAKWVCKVCGYVYEGDEPPANCPQCKTPGTNFYKEESNEMTWAAEHVVGVAKGVPADILQGLRDNFTGECTEVGMYLAMARVAYREGYPEIGLYWEKAAFEEAEHAAKFAELLGEVVTDSTKKNLEMRVAAENGATKGKTELAKRAKEEGLDAIHDTVHEMARDEARHGKALKGLLDRYFK